MPEFSPPLTASLAAHVAALAVYARYGLGAFAAGATILSTACLALQALTALDRRRARRTSPSRQLFVPLDPEDGS